MHSQNVLEAEHAQSKDLTLERNSYHAMVPAICSSLSTEWEEGRETERETGIKGDTETDRDRQTDRQTEKDTE